MLQCNVDAAQGISRLGGDVTGGPVPVVPATATCGPTRTARE
ncbi:hypothetical protein I548_1264 [Mycobacterium intracellulare]|nr:hypothetical protein I548_1264 [Mycobacterium intracellulare]